MATWCRMGVVSSLAVSLLQRAHCSPTRDDHLRHCTDVTQANNLGVIMSDVVQQHICSEVDVDFDSMMERCSAFCGEHAVPVVVGTESVGFPLADIDGVCVGLPSSGGPSSGPGGEDDVIIRHDPQKLQQCEDWSEALHEINLKAADFIASVRNMTLEQLVFRASMKDSVRQVQEAMQSEETTTRMSLARADRKLDSLRRILQDNLADMMGDGMMKQRLRDKLNILRMKSELLQDTINRNLPLLRRFVEECNELLLATGPANEYLLDICSVTSDECIESVDEDGAWGRHAACCCGIVPAVGHFAIPATTLEESRRLQASQPSVDVCGQAYEVGAQSLQEAKDKLCEIPGGSDLVQQHEQTQHEAYPAYFDDCSRRMEEVQVDDLNDLPSDFLPSDLPSTERKLEDLYLTCSPPSSSTDASMTDPLKVAFWDQTETALCKDIQEGSVTMTTPRLAEVCEEFCGEGTVPFLLGTPAFGFSQEQLDSVCLAPEEVPYSAQTVADCHTKALAFETLQAKTAAFAASLQVLQAARMKFEAGTVEASRRFREIIQSEAARVLDDHVQSQKITELKKLFRRALSDIIDTNSATKNELHDDAEAVQRRTEELSAALSDVIPQLEDFMDNCNLLITGVGPSHEYLLDMCSQTSTACIEGEEASHVGCCCGYNPVITLGTTGISAQQTIAGLDAMAFDLAGARTRTGRRLEEGNAIDICAEASIASTPIIERYEQEVRALDAEYADDLITAARESHREQYPAYHRRCSEWSGCAGDVTTTDGPWSAHNSTGASGDTGNSTNAGGGATNAEGDIAHDKAMPQELSMVVSVALILLANLQLRP